MLWLATLIVAQSEVPLTGNPKLDQLLGLATGIATVAGLWFGKNTMDKRKASADPEGPSAELVAQLAERQAAAAEMQKGMATLLARIDDDLRDARERLSAVEARVSGA